MGLLRRHMSTVLVAMVTAAVTAGAPAIAHGVHAAFAHNADKVDGKHAVGSAASTAARKGKVVATSPTTGRLPNNIIAKALNSAKLDGRTAADFDDAATWQGRTHTEIGTNAKSIDTDPPLTLATTTSSFGGPEVQLGSMEFFIPGSVSQGIRMDGAMTLADTMDSTLGCPCEFEVILRDGGTVVGRWVDTFHGVSTEISLWTMARSFIATAGPGAHTWTLSARVYDRDTVVNAVTFDVANVNLIVSTFPFLYG